MVPYPSNLTGSDRVLYTAELYPESIYDKIAKI